MGDNNFEYALQGPYSLQDFSDDFMMWALMSCMREPLELAFLCNGWEL